MTTPADRSPEITRRDMLLAAGVGLAAAGLPNLGCAPAGDSDDSKHLFAHGERKMDTIKTKDGTRIFYKDWGIGTPIVFSHGWPLSADAWDSQMLFFVNRGYRVIAHDRRGHGRSEQTSKGNDMDTYAQDLATLLDALDVRNAMMVGHSTGGGEVVRYLSQHGTGRVAKAVLIGAVPPIMIRTPENPDGQPITNFEGLRAALLADRSSFYRGLAMPFFGFNKPGVTASEGIIDAFWLQSMAGGVKGHYDCIRQFSETDFTADLRRVDIPTLLLHGDADQIVPMADSSILSAKLLPKATLKIYAGAPHGMCVTESAKVNADLLAFLKA